MPPSFSSSVRRAAGSDPIADTAAVKLEVCAAVTMKNGVLWDVPCGFCKNRRFGGT
jgi:hypothetical protein